MVTGDLEKRKQAGTWHVLGLGSGSLVALHVVVREGKKAIIWRGRGFQAERMASAKALRPAGT